MVVGRADEDVSKRVEGERPYVGVVCLGECRAWEECGLEWGRFGTCEVPVENGAFGATGDENRVDGVPGDGCYSRCEARACENDGEDVQQTSFLCPLRTRNSFMARMSNTRTVWSREALARRLPFGDQARAWIVFLC